MDFTGGRGVVSTSGILKKSPAAGKGLFKGDSGEFVLVGIKKGGSHDRQRHADRYAWLIQGAFELVRVRVWNKRHCAAGGADGRHDDCVKQEGNAQIYEEQTKTKAGEPTMPILVELR
jgi:hypothetical protein